jgi:hypothetical protein
VIKKKRKKKRGIHTKLLTKNHSILASIIILK